jgi:diacylglycerol O-acyltransferase / wax synthase
LILILSKKSKTLPKLTVNDVCTALLAGSMRRYLEDQNDDTLSKSDFQFRACLPYGFSRQTNPDKVLDALRNLWILISLHLPVQIPSDKPLQRLFEAKAVCDKLKSSPESLVQYYLQLLAGRSLPYDIQCKTNLGTLMRHSLIYTNLPGPESTVFFCDQPILQFDIAVVNCIPQ